MKNRILSIALAAASIGILAAVGCSTAAEAREPAAYLLAARNDRVPDTKPSYVYAGRHQRVAVVSGYEACRAAGNAMVKLGYKDETGATRFACKRTKLPVGTIYPAAKLYGFAR